MVQRAVSMVSQGKGHLRTFPASAPLWSNNWWAWHLQIWSDTELSRKQDQSVQQSHLETTSDFLEGSVLNPIVQLQTTELTLCIMQLFLVSLLGYNSASQGRLQQIESRTMARFVNNSTSETPVVALGVFLFANKILANFWFRDLGSFFAAFKVCLKVCTNLLASPFDAGW